MQDFVRERGPINYKAKVLGSVIEKKFGVEKLDRIKILLASSKFRQFTKGRTMLSLESYLNVFFGIIVQLSTNFSLQYYVRGATKLSSFTGVDDVLYTATAFGIQVIKENLANKGLLNNLAQKLESHAIYRRTMSSLDSVLKTFEQTFKRKDFEERVVPFMRDYDEDSNKLIEDYDEATRLADDYLVMNSVYGCYVWLREYYAEGGFIPGADPQLIQPNQVKEYLDGGKPFRLEKNDTSDLLRTLGVLDNRVDEVGNYYQYTQVFEPFYIIGGRLIDYTVLKNADICLRPKEDDRQANEAPVRDTPGASGPIEFKQQIKAETPEQLVKENFHVDINANGNSKLIYANSENVEKAWEKASGTTKRTWKKTYISTPTGIKDAIVQGCELLRGKVEISEDELPWLVAGRLLSMKGNLTIEGDKLSRR